MSSVIKNLVDVNVRLGRSKALLELLAHRERLLADLRGRSGRTQEFSRPLRQINDELDIIRAGLADLEAVAA